MGGEDQVSTILSCGDPTEACTVLIFSVPNPPIGSLVLVDRKGMGSFLD